jgi:hypothetical protein
MCIVMSSQLRSRIMIPAPLKRDADDDGLRNFTFMTLTSIFRFQPEAHLNAYPDGSTENARNAT